VYRMQVLVDLADRFGRKVAFVGRGMLETSQAAQRLGYLKLPAGRTIRDSAVMNLPPAEVLCITTGSQGEPMSAMLRMAFDDYRSMQVNPEDTVVFSAHSYQGHEKSLCEVYNHLARSG